MRGWLERSWFAVAPASVALIVGVWGVGTPGPWLDEMITIEALTDGLATHLWEAPMLPYYGLMWVWSAGGSVIDAGWLRIPSVLGFTASAAIVAVTARRLSTPRAGLVAGMVLAVSPGLSRYAQEARTYAIALALVSGATLMLLEAAESDRTRSWAWYSALLGAATLVLPVSLAVLPAHAVILWGQAPPQRRRRWLVSVYFLLPLLALEAGMAFFFTQTRDWLEVPTLTSLLEVPFLLVASEYTSAAYGLAVLLVGLVSPIGRRWIAGLLGSALLIWVVSVTVSNWWLARGFVPLAGIACVAAGVTLARSAWVWIAGVLILLVLLGAGDHRAIRQPFSRGIDPAAIADVLTREAVAGDAVVSRTQWSLPWWSVTHYRVNPGSGLVWATTPSKEARFWSVAEEAPCPGAQGWQVAPDRRLWLCDPSSLDELDGRPQGQRSQDGP